MTSYCEKGSKVTATAVIRAEMEDRLSNLPDDIICRILSSLPARYVVRTSILSSRWKDVFQGIPDINTAIAEDKIVQNAIGIEQIVSSLQTDMREAFQGTQKDMKLAYEKLAEGIKHGLGTLVLLLPVAKYHKEEGGGEPREAEETNTEEFKARNSKLSISATASYCEEGSKVTATAIPAEMEDRLSNLPDDIICHILSSLPARYVVRTSILSSRWKDVFQGIPDINTAIAEDKIVLKAIGIGRMVSSLQADIREVFKGTRKDMKQVYENVTEAMKHSLEALVLLLPLAKFLKEEGGGEAEDVDDSEETANEEAQDGDEEDEDGN